MNSLGSLNLGYAQIPRRNRTTYAFKGRLKGAKKRGKKGEKMQDSCVDPISGGERGVLLPVALTN